MKQLIYLDNAATTKTRPEVVEAMLPYFTAYYGNPSSVYEFSAEPKRAIAQARETIAKALGAKSNEIYFTYGGTESRELHAARARLVDDELCDWEYFDGVGWSRDPLKTCKLEGLDI